VIEAILIALLVDIGLGRSLSPVTGYNRCRIPFISTIRHTRADWSGLIHTGRIGFGSVGLFSSQRKIRGLFGNVLRILNWLDRNACDAICRTSPANMSAARMIPDTIRRIHGMFELYTGL
jgi:hypothetical protein